MAKDAGTLPFEQDATLIGVPDSSSPKSQERVRPRVNISSPTDGAAHAEVRALDNVTPSDMGLVIQDPVATAAVRSTSLNPNVFGGSITELAYIMRNVLLELRVLNHQIKEGLNTTAELDDLRTEASTEDVQLIQQ